MNNFAVDDKILQNINRKYDTNFTANDIPEFIYQFFLINENQYVKNTNNCFYNNQQNYIMPKLHVDFKNYKFNSRKTIKPFPQNIEHGFNSSEINKKLLTEADLVKYVDVMSALIWNAYTTNTNLLPKILLADRDVTPSQNNNDEYVYNLYKLGPIVINMDQEIYDIEDMANISNRQKGKGKFFCKKQFADLLTTFVNSEKIFNENRFDKIVKYQYLINTIFTTIIDNYKIYKNLNYDDIIFMYKGGTSLKIIYEENLKLLSCKNCSNFYDKIKTFFSRSDSDYQIIINPELDNFWKIYSEINKLSLITLRYIKKILIKNEKFFLDFENTIENNDLQKIINDMNEIVKKNKINGVGIVTPILDCSIFNTIDQIIGIEYDKKLYIVPSEYKEFAENNQELFTQNNSARNDIYITKTHINDPTEPVTVGHIEFNDSNDTKSNIFLSANETLYTKEDVYINSFHLSRLKYNFKIYFKYVQNHQIKTTKKYGSFHTYSELVDLTIGRKHTIEQSIGFYKHKLNVFEYIYKNNSTDMLNVKYVGYTVYGFIADFEKMFLMESVYPWLDAKWKKRLYRLLFLIFLELVLANKFTETNINMMQILLKQLKVRHIKNINENLLKELEIEIGETATFKFIKNLMKIQNFTPSNESNLFFQIIDDTFKEFITLATNTNFENYNKNKSESGSRSESIFDNVIKITHLGGYKNKYDKYLKKNKKLLKTINENNHLE